jgi:predicted nucleic acid-binding protein
MPPIALLDTTVFLDLVGERQHERHMAELIVSLGVSGDVQAVVTLQSIQELLHVRTRKGTPQEKVIEYARWIGRTFDVLPHHSGDVDVMLELLTEHPTLGAADAMIYAAGLRAEVSHVITRDRSFGLAVGDRWIDPSSPAKVERLITGD